MDALFGLLGFLCIIIGLIMILIRLIRKKSVKPAFALFVASFFLLVVGFSMSLNEAPSKSPAGPVVHDNEPEGDVQLEKDEENTPKAFRELIEKIELTYRIQDIYDNKRKVVIWVSNNSEHIFSGNLLLDIKSREGHILAIDSFPIDDFKPGQKKYIVMMADTTYPIDKATASWSDIEFVESPIKEANKIVDEVATEEVMDDMYMSFGGGGNPELETSWYHYIENIEVYTDGENKWAEVTLNTNDQDISDSIGLTVLYIEKYITMVQVFDESHAKICEIHK